MVSGRLEEVDAIQPAVSLLATIAFPSGWDEQMHPTGGRLGDRLRLGRGGSSD